MSDDRTESDRSRNRKARLAEVVGALECNGSHALLEPYLDKSRWICQSIHPFLDLTRVFFGGVPEARDEDNDEEYTEDEILAFAQVMKLQRGFRVLVEGCMENPAAFLNLIHKISTASSASRSEDTNTLKTQILTLLFEDERGGSPFSEQRRYRALSPSDSKSLRGFTHIDTAFLLCPLRLIEDFYKDPESIMDQVKNGQILLDETDLPFFLYDSETEYDEDGEFNGLFRGHVLIRVYRSIFTGPSSALDPSKRANKYKAKIFDLKTTTAQTIAYSAVQASVMFFIYVLFLTALVKTYVSLSSMSQWGSVDGNFDLAGFYDHLVSILESAADTEWGKETMDWFEQQVPGLRQKAAGKKGKGPGQIRQKNRSSPAERITMQLAQLAQKLTRQPIGPASNNGDVVQGSQLTEEEDNEEETTGANKHHPPTGNAAEDPTEPHQRHRQQVHDQQKEDEHAEQERMQLEEEELERREEEEKEAQRIKAEIEQKQRAQSKKTGKRSLSAAFGDDSDLSDPPSDTPRKGRQVTQQSQPVLRRSRREPTLRTQPTKPLKSQTDKKSANSRKPH